jgi:hypothetical protein
MGTSGKLSWVRRWAGVNKRVRTDDDCTRRERRRKKTKQRVSSMDPSVAESEDVEAYLVSFGSSYPRSDRNKTRTAGSESKEQVKEASASPQLPRPSELSLDLRVRQEKG